MRWMYLTIIALFAAAVVVFAFQNFEVVTVSFLGFSIRIRIGDSGLPGLCAGCRNRRHPVYAVASDV